MSKIFKLKRKFYDQQGQVAVIVGLLIIAFVGITALVVDMGSMYEDRRELQSVADAASLAGAQELPESPTSANTEATLYITTNRPDITTIDIQVGTYFVANDQITVTVNNPDSPVYFGRIFGVNSVNVGATATAIVAKPDSLSNVVPWAAHLEEGEELSDWIDTVTPMTLKFGAGSSIEGNFYALDLNSINEDHPASGGSDYYQYIVEGYPGRIQALDTVWTEPGNKNKTGSQVEERLIINGGDGTPKDFWSIATYKDDILTLGVNNGQLVYVPVIRVLENPTGRDQVTILALAPFIITEFTIHQGQGYVKGQFIEKALIVDDTDDIVAVEPTGFRVIRLIK